jgi:hypothetical protein
VSTALVLVVVFSAVALGLSAFAVWVSWGARRTAHEAHDAARRLASAAARRRRAERNERGAEGEVDERDVDLGAPHAVPERRRQDLGLAGRHRPPDDRYPRLRASADAREAAEADAGDPTTAIAAVRGDELPATAEHPAPTSTYRRPPPPLPRPGSIGRP